MSGRAKNAIAGVLLADCLAAVALWMIPAELSGFVLARDLIWFLPANMMFGLAIAIDGPTEDEVHD